MLKYNSIQNLNKKLLRGSRAMNIFIKRAQPAKLMLGEAPSPFCIPVAGHKYISIQNLNKIRGLIKK